MKHLILSSLLLLSAGSSYSQDSHFELKVPFSADVTRISDDKIKVENLRYEYKGEKYYPGLGRNVSLVSLANSMCRKMGHTLARRLRTLSEDEIYTKEGGFKGRQYNLETATINILMKRTYLSGQSYYNPHETLTEDYLGIFSLGDRIIKDKIKLEKEDRKVIEDQTGSYRDAIFPPITLLESFECVRI